MLGAIVGFLSGLLGIGGGLIIVPTLNYLLPLLDIPPSLVMPMALATSLASIIMTSSSSAYSHYRLGNVDTSVIKNLLPGVLIGAAMGSVIADALPTAYLPKIFGAIVLLLALQMGLSLSFKGGKPFPSKGKNVCSGTFIGTVSSLAGIGGGVLIVPYLNYFGIRMQSAIGSASLCAVFLAFSGMLGFVVIGLQQPLALPSLSLGYVYLPALLGIVVTSVLTTRIGAKMATKLPTVFLKRIFSLFLLCIGVSMFF